MDELSLGLLREERMRKRRDFLQVYSTGEKVHTPFFVLYLVENNKDVSRLGVTASRRIGKAAARNRIKRRLREVFRLNRSCLAESCDLVFNVKRAAGAASWRELENAFREAVQTWRRRRLRS